MIVLLNKNMSVVKSYCILKKCVRPMKIGNNSDADTDADADTEIILKKRGRPMKNCNNADTDANANANADTETEIILKKPRARPRKIISDTEIILKKPRGRPRKIISETEIILKKPRGRPRKNCENIISSIFINPNKSFEYNQNKKYVNCIFSTNNTGLILQYCNIINKYYVGILDGIERNSSTELISNSIDKESILLIEANQIVSISHKKAGFFTHDGTLESFANDSNDEKYSQIQTPTNWRKQICFGWYFDTCGTILTQKKGIFDTILKTKFIDGSVLGFTFCRSRMTKEKYKSDKDNFLQQLNQCLLISSFKIDSCIIDHDYSGNNLLKRARESHMNSFIYTIRKFI